MIIPPRSVIKMGKATLPIMGLSARELLDPEGVGFDLRLAQIHELEGQGELLVETRKTPAAAEVTVDSDGIYRLKSKKWYLATTAETVQLPLDLAALTFPRSTLFRSGVELHTSVTPPGYEGSLTFGLYVVQPGGFRIERGARFCHLVLLQVKKGATPYRGQWNKGRISSPKSERQV